MLLADFGADVVKVERPNVGDPLRTWTTEGTPYWWKVYARNKRLITLDLRQPEGQALLKRLLPRFDVLIESFIPGTLEEWGLAPELLQQINPSLVIARISGWGQTGPKSGLPGFGTLVEAATGFAAMSGEASGPPLLPGFPVADMVTGLFTTNAIMFALYHRDVNQGRGQVIDASLFESLSSLLGPLPAEYAALGKVRLRQGSRSRNAGPRGVFGTSDGHWIALDASTPKMTKRLFEGYGLGKMIQDPRFANNESRVQHAAEFEALLSDIIGQRTLEENLRIIRENELTAAQVQTIADVEQDPHWRSRGFLRDVAGRDGRAFRMHAAVPFLSSTPGELRWPGGELGQDNSAVYGGELGLSDREIDELQRAAVI
jgi:formyl-CoA transferase